METTVEDLQWDIEKLRKREQKLNKHLAEALEQVRLGHRVIWSQCKVLGAWAPLFHPHLSLFSPQLNSGYYVSGSSSGFQGGQITLSMQKVSSSFLPPPTPPPPYPPTPPPPLYCIIEILLKVKDRRPAVVPEDFSCHSRCFVSCSHMCIQ